MLIKRKDSDCYLVKDGTSLKQAIREALTMAIINERKIACIIRYKGKQFFFFVKPYEDTDVAYQRIYQEYQKQP
jgi:3-deoxy-D-manno-octulosonate 8-phosphate phosphatase KdsC-like HAD superfamily phosphatase